MVSKLTKPQIFWYHREPMLDQTSPTGPAGRDYDWFTSEYIRSKIISINRILFLVWLLLISVIFDAPFNCKRAARNTYVRLYDVISHDLINLPKTHYRMARLKYSLSSFTYMRSWCQPMMLWMYSSIISKGVSYQILKQKFQNINQGRSQGSIKYKWIYGP